MLDGVTLDQLRTFIAAADEGSFSAAGRKLRRAQSVVSQTLANLEGQLGVTLFDRSGRYPRVTDEGRSLLVDARAVADATDALKARARAMHEGLEPELAVAVDVMYPLERLTRAASESRKLFPHTALRVYVEALGGVIKPVLDGTCNVGVIGSLPIVPDELTAEPLLDVPFVTVVAPSHGSPRAAARYPRRRSRSTCSSCSPTARRSRRAASIRCSRRSPGGSPISARSTRSCAPASVGATCRCISCRRMSTPARSSRFASRTRRGQCSCR